MTMNDESVIAALERVARELLVVAQRLREKDGPVEPPAAAIEQAKKQICLSCNGKDQPAGKKLKRGQCVNCYPKTMRRIKAGKLVESRLIALGKLLPGGNPGRSLSDFPLDALVEADSDEQLADAKRKAKAAIKKKQPKP